MLAIPFCHVGSLAIMFPSLKSSLAPPTVFVVMLVACPSPGFLALSVVVTFTS